jgi:hypothetical protein
MRVDLVVVASIALLALACGESGDSDSGPHLGTGEGGAGGAEGAGGAAGTAEVSLLRPEELLTVWQGVRHALDQPCDSEPTSFSAGTPYGNYITFELATETTLRVHRCNGPDDCVEASSSDFGSIVIVDGVVTTGQLVSREDLGDGTCLITRTLVAPTLNGDTLRITMTQETATAPIDGTQCPREATGEYACQSVDVLEYERAL